MLRKLWWLVGLVATVAFLMAAPSALAGVGVGHGIIGNIDPSAIATNAANAANSASNTASQSNAATQSLGVTQDANATSGTAVSKGGSDKHPDWYLNLIADPHVVVEIGPDRLDSIAAPLEGEERDQAEGRARSLGGHLRARAPSRTVAGQRVGRREPRRDSSMPGTAAAR